MISRAALGGAGAVSARHPSAGELGGFALCWHWYFLHWLTILFGQLSGTWGFCFPLGNPTISFLVLKHLLVKEEELNPSICSVSRAAVVVS